VKDYIQSRIASGEWTEHTRLPSEHELRRQTGFARMTIHRALRELADKGVLLRIQGVGTFVAEQRPHAALLEINSIAHEIRTRGHAYSCDVHLLERERIDEATARTLNLLPESAVFHCVAVHFEDGQPVQHEERYVNPAMAPAYLRQDFTRITTHDYLMTIGPLSEAEHTVEALLPSPEIGRLLHLGANEPCLRVTRRTWTLGTWVTVARLTSPGMRYRLRSRKITPV
jgi:GntR family histidine utilization transcriptional repressor|tara:strand:+ start:769 stop:1452 length:684 start_codon:yes stop_codon:yes gene_type:complete